MRIIADSNIFKAADYNYEHGTAGKSIICKQSPGWGSGHKKKANTNSNVDQRAKAPFYFACLFDLTLKGLQIKILFTNIQQAVTWLGRITDPLGTLIMRHLLA